MMSYRGQVRLGVNVDTALVKSAEAAHQLVEDTVAQTSLLLMDLRATEADPGNALSSSECELLLGERTHLQTSPHHPSRGCQAPATSTD